MTTELIFLPMSFLDRSMYLASSREEGVCFLISYMNKAVYGREIELNQHKETPIWLLVVLHANEGSTSRGLSFECNSVSQPNAMAMSPKSPLRLTRTNMKCVFTIQCVPDSLFSCRAIFIGCAAHCHSCKGGGSHSGNYSMTGENGRAPPKICRPSRRN